MDRTLYLYRLPSLSACIKVQLRVLQPYVMVIMAQLFRAQVVVVYSPYVRHTSFSCLCCRFRVD
jgi:hypothetical protein